MARRSVRDDTGTSDPRLRCQVTGESALTDGLTVRGVTGLDGRGVGKPGRGGGSPQRGGTHSAAQWCVAMCTRRTAGEFRPSGVISVKADIRGFAIILSKAL